MIALQTQRLTPAPGAGTFSGDPRGFEGDGCDPGVSGCTVTATGTSTPYSNPTFANFTMIGTGQLAGIPNDGNGGVWRRGTGGYAANGVLSRWKGFGISIRDAWTDTLFTQLDSLTIASVLLTQNGANFDTTGAAYAAPANWPAADYNTLKLYGSTVSVDTLLGISTNPAGLNWAPKAGSPASSGAVTVPASRVGGYFGNSWQNTAYLGACDVVCTWYQGWTVYQIN